MAAKLFRRSLRRGLTLVEVLVAMGIVGLLLSLLVPAVQVVRESARRAQCLSNLHQIGVGIHNFESTHGRLPCDSLTLWDILPNVDSGVAFVGSSWDELKVPIPLYLCPSDNDRSESPPLISYSTNDGNGVQRYGHNGVVPDDLARAGESPYVRLQDISDGTTATVMMSERLIQTNGEPSRLRKPRHVPVALRLPDELDQFAQSCLESTVVMPPHVFYHLGGGPQLSNGLIHRHILPPNSNSCLNGPPGTGMDFLLASFGQATASSLHRGGVNVLMCDGSVKFASEHLDRKVWSAAGSRNGQESLGALP